MSYTRFALRGCAKVRCLPLVLFLLLALSTRAAAQVSVTATAGTVGPTTYTTLKSAFDAVNAGTHQGAINVSITGNTSETATSVLEASGVGSANYSSVLVKPAAATTPVVSASLTANSAVIKLNGADNVTVDGSNAVNGTTQDLMLQITSIANTAVVWIASASATNGATNNTIKNCQLRGLGYGASAATIGIAAGSGTTLGLPADFANSNNTVQNNTITRCQNAAFIYGYGIDPYDDNWTVSGNTFGSTTTAADYLNFRGMLFYNASNFQISGNMIAGVHSTATTTVLMNGMQIGGALSTGSVSNNKITNVKHNNTNGATTTTGAFGIYIAATTAASNVSFHNNFVGDIAAYGHTTILSQGGIYFTGTGGGFRLHHNSVSLTTNPGLATAYTVALIVNSTLPAASLDIRNNIFSNTQNTTSGASRMAVYLLGTNTAVIQTINYNDYYSTGTYLGVAAGVFRATLANWQTATLQDAQSKNILPNFVSATDLHLPAANNTTLDNQGTPITGITTDIDGQTRSTTTPDIGADEFTLCPTITFTIPPAQVTACDGGTTTIPTTSITNATGYQWQVNTGTGWTSLTNTAPYSGATTPNLAITGATLAMNNYQYRLYATSACGSDTSAARTVIVYAIPAAPSVSSNSPVCAGNTINLNAAPVANGTFAWSGPGGYTAGTQNATRPSATTAMSGSYSATVMVDGCTSPASPVPVIVNPTPQIATAAGANPTSCGAADGSIALTGLAASTAYSVTYLKDGNPAGPVSLTSDAGGILTIPGLTAGAYTSIVVTGMNCPSAATTSTVNLVDPSAPAQPSIIGGQATGCIGLAQTYSVTAVPGITYTWTLPTGWSGSSTSNSIAATAGANAQAGNITVIANNTCGSSIVRTLAVTVSSTPAQPNLIVGAGSTCAGVAQTYSILPVLGADSYTWTLPTGWSGSSNATSIATSPTATGGVITVTATNICGTSTSSSKTIVSNPVVSPSVIISPSTATTICAGTPVTFTAVPTGGGTAPSYQWVRNGVSTGNYSAVYSNNTLVSGDVISLSMTSSAACALPSATVNAASVVMTVQPTTATGINVNAAFGTAPVVCPGTPVSFTANITGGGSTPSYQWMINSTPVGTNAPAFTASTLSPGDSVSCILTSSANCPASLLTVSNKMGLQVSSIIVPQLSILATPDTNMAGGQPVTFTAIVNGQGPTPGYQWFKNGSPIGGAIGSAYTTSSWVTGDQFYLRLVSSAPCAAPNVLTSNRLRMHATTSVGAVAGSAGLSLWPNPNSGRFTLALTNAAGNVRTRVEILNALGQVVYFREVIVDRKDWSTDIELGAGIANGMYLLRLSAENGTRTTERFEVRR